MKRPFIFKPISVMLIITHVIVFCTHEVQLAEAQQEQNAAYSGNGQTVSSQAIGNQYVDLFTGQAATAVPIFVPPARSEFQPNVSLNYSSGTGNTWLGVGWSCDFGGITRSAKRGVPKYDDSDTFVINFGGVSSELVAIGNNEFRAKHESMFFKVIKGDGFWHVYDKTGTKYSFGEDDNSRVNGAPGTFAWLINRAEDTNGNFIVYSYLKDAGQIYPDSIHYNGNSISNFEPTHHVKFTLEDRDDKTVSYRTGFSIKTTKRLASVESHVEEQLVKKYNIKYEYSPSTMRSRLKSVTEVGNDGITELPPVTFTYTDLDKSFAEPIDFTNVQNQGEARLNYPIFSQGTSYYYRATHSGLVDINGDGLLDRIMKGPGHGKKGDHSVSTWYVQLGSREGTHFEGSFLWENVSYHVAEQNYPAFMDTNHPSRDESYLWSAFLDVNSDGRADRVYLDWEYMQALWRVELNKKDGSFEDRSTWPLNNLGWGNLYHPVQSQKVESKKNFRTVSGLMDFNGDGYPDRILYRNQDWRVLFGNGSGFDPAVSWEGAQSFGKEKYNYLSSLDGVNDTGVKVDNMLIDINGDGFIDRVLQTGNSSVWKVQFNNGKGFEPAEDWGGVDGLSTSGLEYLRYSEDYKTKLDLMDINADGLPDRVMQTSGSNNYFMVQINTGTGFASPIRWEGVSNFGDANLGFIDRNVNDFDQNRDGYFVERVGMYDINGDGLLDRVIQNSKTNPFFKVQKNSGDAPDRLKEISNGRGGQAALTYKPSTRYDNTGDDDVSDLGMPVYTVENVVISDGLGNSYETQYDYEGGKFDYQDKEFRGFHKVVVSDPVGNQTINHYYQDDVKKGKLSKSETQDASGNTFVKKELHWSVSNPHSGVFFPYIQHEDTFTYDGDATYRRKRTTYTYDSYGNLSEAAELGEFYEPSVDGRSNILGDERKVIHTYAHNPDVWIMGAVSREEIKDHANNIIRAEQFYYDSAQTINTPPIKGNITQEELWYAEGDNPKTIMTYDEYGNLETITDSLGNITTNIMEEIYYQYVKTSTNALGHQENFVYDARFGELTETIDVNGQKYLKVYDAFGRILQVILPGDSVELPTKQFEYRPYESSHKLERVRLDVRETSGASDVLTTYSFVDGLGRKIQSRVETERSNRQSVLDEIRFDNRGFVQYQYVPYFADTAQEYAPVLETTPKTSLVYDTLGRELTAVFPDGSFKETHYADWNITSSTNNVDLNNEQRMVDVLDAYGRIKEVHEFNKGEEYVTTYEYESTGDLKQIRDHLGNLTTIQYDSLGRKVSLADPNVGVSSYDYYANGNLKSQSDAKGITTTIIYDVLNRIKEKTYSNSNQKVNYTYDAPDKTNSVGRLTSVSNGVSTIEYAYDSRGNVKERCQEGYCYVYDYDAMDRQVDITYPDGEKVHYTFNQMGEIEKVGKVVSGQGMDDDFYIKNVDYNAAAQMTKIEYGNGVASDYVYDPKTLRLERLTSKRSNQTLLQDFVYDFDNNGNVRSITDHVNTASQTFGYDDLNRLDWAQGSYGHIDYDYDAIGNIRQKGDVTFNYAEDGAGPHQMSSDSNGKVFGYDANGNMITRGQEELIYDAENRLTQVIREGSARGQQGYTLAPGWNLISFPYLPQDKSIVSVLERAGLTFGQDVDQISFYDATQGDWQHFVNHEMFNDFDQFTYAQGYEIYVINPDGVQFTIEGMASTSEVSVSLASGDNYFGIIADASLPVPEVFNGVAYSSIKGYDADTGTWSLVAESDQLEAGHAYVVDVEEGQSLVLRSDVSGVSYAYGPDDERVQKVTSDKTTTYIGSRFRIENEEQVKSMFLGSLRIAESRSDGDLKFLHTDHLNSTNVVTDADGEQVKLYEYKPYGQTQVSRGDADVNYKFTGQEEDGESNLYYYHARYYDPEIGRFIQPDSFVQEPYDPQTLNRYAYCRNNPVKFIDPSGNFFDIIIGAIVGAVIGGINAAVTGGNIVKGILTGAVQGAAFAFVGGMQLTGMEATLGHFVSGVAVGGINAAITGGDVGMGMAIGGFSAGVSQLIGGYFGGDVSFDSKLMTYLFNVSQRAVIGGIMGGVAAELAGGSFREGAKQGAITSSIAYTANHWLHRTFGVSENNNSRNKNSNRGGGLSNRFKELENRAFSSLNVKGQRFRMIRGSSGGINWTTVGIGVATTGVGISTMVGAVSAGTAITAATGGLGFSPGVAAAGSGLTTGLVLTAYGLGEITNGFYGDESGLMPFLETLYGSPPEATAVNPF